jgi:hypothetical protein
MAHEMLRAGTGQTHYIKMDLKEVGCGGGGMDWTKLAQDRCRQLVNAVMNHRVPQNAGNFLTS